MSLDHYVSSISDTVHNMYASAYQASILAETLRCYRDSASKYQLEVKLKTVKGLLESALEQLEIADL